MGKKIIYANRLLGEDPSSVPQRDPAEIEKVLKALKPVMEETKKSWEEAKMTVKEFAAKLVGRGLLVLDFQGGFKCAVCGTYITKENLKNHFESVDRYPKCTAEIAQKTFMSKSVQLECVFGTPTANTTGVVIVGRVIKGALHRALRELYAKEKVQLTPKSRGRIVAEIIRDFVTEEIKIEEGQTAVFISRR